VTKNGGEKPLRTAAHRAVAALALLTAILGLANLGRMAMAIRYAGRLPDLPMTVTWPYLAVKGGLWGVGFITCTAGLLRLQPWGRWATLAASTLYQLHVWIDHALFDASDYARQTRPRDLALTILFLGIVWGVLNWPTVRRIFRHQGATD
jgi:hypothetical protein